MQGGVQRRPIDALLRPRSVAFIGVSARGGPGAKMLASAQTSGFSGGIWPINPNQPEIAGVACFPSLQALPAVPDCIIVAVPADAVLGVLGEAATIGIPSALVVSEGFADTGDDDGRARQRALVDFAQRSKMAVAGPNCMGIATLHHRYAATMADIPRTAVVGGISLVSQSGGLLNAVAELATNRGIGLNYLVSIGNQAVVDLPDYIAHLADDEATTAIALIMEGVTDGRRFRAAIEHAARRKPIVVLKLGRSASGQAATFAHTGTLAGRHEAFAALFRRTGVALVESIDELVETAALMELAPLPAGDRVCMLTVSGGATSLIADLGERAGIRFALISAETSRSLGRILGVERSFANPVDTVGMPRLRKAGNMAAVIDTLLADDGIDVIGLVLGMRRDGIEAHQALVDDLASVAAQSKKPLMVVSFISNSLTAHWRDYARRHRLPLLEDLELGMRAVRHLINHAAARQRFAAEAPEGASAARAQTLSLDAGVVLSEAESKQILACAGLPVTRERLARSPEDAAALFAEIGGKVALKVQSPDIPHKSEVGGVHLGAQTAAEVERAARQVLDNARKARPDARIDGVLVQEMIEDAAEFILGMTYDGQFGPLIVCGAGGITVEVFKDAAVRLPPLGPEDAREMLAGLKAAPLLAGFRGAPPLDVEAFVDCIVRFAGFAAATDGQLAAIDLNPVLVRARGQGVRIADALIVTRKPKDEARHA